MARVRVGKGVYESTKRGNGDPTENQPEEDKSGEEIAVSIGGREEESVSKGGEEESVSKCGEEDVANEVVEEEVGKDIEVMKEEEEEEVEKDDEVMEEEEVEKDDEVLEEEVEKDDEVVEEEVGKDIEVMEEEEVEKDDEVLEEEVEKDDEVVEEEEVEVEKDNEEEENANQESGDEEVENSNKESEEEGNEDGEEENAREGDEEEEENRESIPTFPATNSRVEENEETEDVDDTQPLQPERMFFPPTEYIKGCKIGTRCTVPKTVEYIEQFPVEIKWFTNHSQFKDIFHMPREPNHMIQGMWMLLLRTACTYLDRECWFMVNEVPIRYSIKEHALLTGLDRHEYPSNWKELGDFRFAERVFGRKVGIKIKDVKEKLNGMSKTTRSTDRKKLTILYFLCKVVKEKAKADGNIDSFILRVVNDLTACENFLWGSYTCEECLKGIEAITKNMKGSVKPKAQTCFSGFIFLEHLPNTDGRLASVRVRLGEKSFYSVRDTAADIIVGLEP